MILSAASPVAELAELTAHYVRSTHAQARLDCARTGPGRDARAAHESAAARDPGPF